jgi:molybdate transport system substrate-binding protein
MNRTRMSLGAAAMAALALAGCSSSSSGSSGTSSSTAPATSTATSASAAGSTAPASGNLTVLAASSLTESFTTIGKQFEAANPGSKVTFSFGSSGDLAQQIVQGSPADVFASASPKTMQTVTDGGEATGPQTLATNILEIATPPGDPAGIEGLNDLTKPGIKLAVCAVSAPCGVVAQTLFTNNKLTVKPVTEEVDVKSVLAKVELGSVDAGIVYVTDVKAAGTKVVGVGIPSSQNVSTSYPIAALNRSKQATLAQAFVAYVLSAPGQAVLKAAGFGAP